MGGPKERRINYCQLEYQFVEEAMAIINQIKCVFG